MQEYSPDGNDFKGFSISDTLGLIFTAAYVWALPWEMLLRRQFGRHYISPWFIATLIWPMLFAGLIAPERDMTWSICFFWLLIFLALFHRGIGLYLDAKGVIRHSQYSGYPWLCSIFKVDEAVCKARYEPSLMLILIFIAFVIEPVMGLFLLGGFVALIVKLALIDLLMKNKTTQLDDAYLEQMATAERFRDRWKR